MFGTQSVQGIPATINKGKDSSNGTPVVHTISSDDGMNFVVETP